MTHKVILRTKDGFYLDGIFTRVEGSNKGIIFTHGMTVTKDGEGFMVEAEPRLNELGYSTLRFDFRAHGKSEGNSIKDFTISGELLDLQTAVEFIKSKGVAWLGLCGASFGGSIVSLYAGDHPQDIKAIFLANPSLSYIKDFLKPVTWWGQEYFTNYPTRLGKEGFLRVGSKGFKVGPTLIEEMGRYHPFEALQAYQGPLFIIHGTKDNTIDIRHTQEYFHRLDNPHKQLHILEGAWHGFHTQPYKDEAANLLVDFFSCYKT